MDNLVGLIVRSKAGRDKGEYFLVLKTEAEFLYMANGDSRKVDSPKKKKLKHLQKTGYVSEFVKNRLQTIGKVTNSELRKALAEYLNR